MGRRPRLNAARGAPCQPHACGSASAQASPHHDQRHCVLAPDVGRRTRKEHGGVCAWEERAQACNLLPVQRALLAEAGLRPGQAAVGEHGRAASAWDHARPYHCCRRHGPRTFGCPPAEPAANVAGEARLVENRSSAPCRSADGLQTPRQRFGRQRSHRDGNLGPPVAWPKRRGAKHRV